jgi:hypothetical protein
LAEAVEWCGETVTVREATRLRRLAAEDQAGEPDGDSRDDAGDDGTALASAESGGAGAGSAA